MSFIPFQEEDLTPDDATLYEVGERYLSAIQRNVASGMNAKGEAIGTDLYRTGDMLYRNVSVSVLPEARLTVDFNTDYAKHVERRFHFAGLPEGKQQQFLSDLSSVEVRLKG